MRVKENKLHNRKNINTYVDQITWDWLFFKGQLIFGSILTLGILIFLIWFAG